MTTQRNVRLAGPWHILGQDPQPLDPKAVRLPDRPGADWLAISVPGDVNQALLEHGKIPDPHQDVNARQCYWVTAKDWWYLKTFDGNLGHRENVELFLDGVDGPADAWLNGHYLGEMLNYFHPHSFDITERLRAKDNQLLIRFRSLGRLLGDQDIAKKKEGIAYIDGASWIRKPQFSFGWDWALPLPSIGLGGEAELRIDNRKHFRDFGFRTFTSGRVDFFFEVSKAAREAGYDILLNVKGQGATLLERIHGKPEAAFIGHGANGSEAEAAHYKSYKTLQIPHPKLWWPNGFGEPALYDYEVILKVNGKPVDTRCGRLGLREVQTFEEPFREESGPGFSFGLKINGEKIFCKGANMAPFEIWLANATADQYRFYLQTCKEANFNMVRVWGGGPYERELFYELCDEMGLMVWQDFMFASAGYPLPLLRESILTEANYQVRRLRKHACVVLWCGGNEDVYSWKHPLDTKASAQRDTNDEVTGSAEQAWKVDRLKYDPELYGILLRGVVGQLGMGVPYVESSPTSYDDVGNAPYSGNSHVSVLKYAMFQSDGRPETFRKYFDQVYSFDSEFAIHGPCAVASYKRFLAPENVWPPNDAWIFHIQRGHYGIPYYEQTHKLAGAILGPMNDLSTFVKQGQTVHFEFMRGEFESARRNRPDCGGTMFWMFNDCWPTANWSVIDYYRTPKPAYYAAKRACAPLLPIVMERKGVIEFFMSNESAKAVKLEYAYGASKFDGRPILTRTKRCALPANSVIRVATFDKQKHELAPGAYWFVRAKAEGKPLPTVTYFPDGWKDIPWPTPEVSVRILDERKEGRTVVTLLEIATNAFARLFHVAYPDDKAEAWFSDNYFDLPAREKCQITVTSCKPLKAAKLQMGHWKTEWS